MQETYAPLLRQAAAEIRRLRGENEILGSKVWGFEAALQLLYSTPPTVSRGEAEDLAERLDKEAWELEHPENKAQEEHLYARNK